MEDSLQDCNPEIDPQTGENVYAEMNTGDFWKLDVNYVAQTIWIPYQNLNETDCRKNSAPSISSLVAHLWTALVY